MEMIDRRDIEYRGRKITVTVVCDDYHGIPGEEADCYNPEDIGAWLRDEWNYVGVLLTEGAEELGSLWGVEFGRLATVDIDMDRIMGTHPVPDMLASLPLPTWTVIGGWDDDTAVPVGAVRGEREVSGGNEDFFSAGLWATHVEAVDGESACVVAARHMEEVNEA